LSFFVFWQYVVVVMQGGKPETPASAITILRTCLRRMKPESLTGILAAACSCLSEFIPPHPLPITLCRLSFGAPVEKWPMLLRSYSR
jgi:hypothetical protein